MNKNIKSDTMEKMGRISRKLFSARPQGANPHVGRTQGLMLEIITNNPNISQDELAQKLQLDKTTIAKAIKKMEHHNMIERKKSETDGRKYELCVTQRAMEIKDKISKHRIEHSNLAFEGIDEAEINAFSLTLDKIENNIERNRLDMRKNRFETAAKAVKLITENPGLTEEELFQKSGMDPEQFERVMNGLQNRGFVEVKELKFYATDRAAEMKERMKNGKPMGKRRPHHRGHGHRRPFDDSDN